MIHQRSVTVQVGYPVDVLKTAFDTCGVEYESVATYQNMVVVTVSGQAENIMKFYGVVLSPENHFG